MSTWANVAKLVRTKNLDGGLVVESTTGLPLHLAAGIEVSFVPPTLEGPRHATVLKVSEPNTQATTVLFDAVTSIEDAQDLVGCYCLIDRDKYPDYPISSAICENETLVGYVLSDKINGDIGQVKYLNESGPQAHLVIETNAGEVLIPFVDEIIISIDHDKKSIEADLPHGILEL